MAQIDRSKGLGPWTAAGRCVIPVEKQVRTQNLKTNKNKSPRELKHTSNEFSRLCKYTSLLLLYYIHTCMFCIHVLNSTSLYSVRVSSKPTCALHSVSLKRILFYLPPCHTKAYRYGYFFHCHPVIFCYLDYLELLHYFLGYLDTTALSALLYSLLFTLFVISLV